MLARFAIARAPLILKRRTPPRQPQWDLIAGLSVGAMMVPSGLSYAAIAGLPAVMGLYGAFVP